MARHFYFQQIKAHNSRQSEAMHEARRQDQDKTHCSSQTWGVKQRRLSKNCHETPKSSFSSLQAASLVSAIVQHLSSTNCRWRYNYCHWSVSAHRTGMTRSIMCVCMTERVWVRRCTVVTYVTVDLLRASDVARGQCHLRLPVGWCARRVATSGRPREATVHSRPLHQALLVRQRRRRERLRASAVDVLQRARVPRRLHGDARRRRLWRQRRVQRPRRRILRSVQVNKLHSSVHRLNGLLDNFLLLLITITITTTITILTTNDSNCQSHMTACKYSFWPL